ncbi:MAG: hypothetical protein ACLQE9_10415 [Roseiarcus sp.]
MSTEKLWTYRDESGRYEIISEGLLIKLVKNNLVSRKATVKKHGENEWKDITSTIFKSHFPNEITQGATKKQKRSSYNLNWKVIAAGICFSAFGIYFLGNGVADPDCGGAAAKAAALQTIKQQLPTQLTETIVVNSQQTADLIAALDLYPKELRASIGRDLLLQTSMTMCNTLANFPDRTNLTDKETSRLGFCQNYISAKDKAIQNTNYTLDATQTTNFDNATKKAECEANLQQTIPSWGTAVAHIKYRIEKAADNKLSVTLHGLQEIKGSFKLDSSKAADKSE